MKKVMQKIRNKKGFTLIELLVVIVIIAILAAIAVPSMIGFRKDAEKAAAEANARTAYTALSAATAKIVPNNGGTAANGLDQAALTDTAATNFNKKVAELLGTGFGGTIAWTVVGGSSIESVSWASSNEDRKTGGDLKYVTYTPSAAAGSQFEYPNGSKWK